MRLIDALKRNVDPSISARSLKRALEDNACRINGRIERFASVVLEKGTVVEFTLPLVLEEKKCDPTILYENEDLLVIDKPVGMVCQDGCIKGPAFLAHRLDKDTTGVLLFAKKREVAQELQDYFRERKVEKEYLALVDGVPREKSGLIKNFLVKKKTFQGQTIWGGSSNGKGLFAETFWTCLSTMGDSSLLLCQPKTGRTHQLRVHLAEMGHPILIDRQYADTFSSRSTASRPLLHAHRLRFEWRGKSLAIEAPIPKDMPSIA
jgi:23S rRNA pseudouridine955/2504/2580 synthase/23S rRNA pseudouridine1911/1915/1917 synthase